MQKRRLNKEQLEILEDYFNAGYIRVVAKQMPNLLALWRGKAWEHFENEGISNWKEYCDAKLGGFPNLGGHAPDLVKALRKNGLSTSEIAEFMNVSVIELKGVQ